MLPTHCFSYDIVPKQFLHRGFLSHSPMCGRGDVLQRGWIYKKIWSENKIEINVTEIHSFYCYWNPDSVLLESNVWHDFFFWKTILKPPLKIRECKVKAKQITNSICGSCGAEGFRRMLESIAKLKLWLLLIWFNSSLIFIFIQALSQCFPLS